MGNKSLATPRMRLVLPLIKIDVVAVGKGFGLYAAAHFFGRAAGMDAHATEVGTEARLHEGTGGIGHGRPATFGTV